MIDSPAEIVRSYRMAADPKKQIKVLAELNACSVKEIRQVLVGEGVLPRETEIPGEPKKAAKKRFDEETARTLYEEGLDDAAIAKATGMTAHTVAKWRSRNGLRKKARKPRMKKQVDVPSTKPSEAEPDVQKISVVGEAVEVTEPDFTKNAAPEPRTVTVEELRARTAVRGVIAPTCRPMRGMCSTPRNCAPCWRMLAGTASGSARCSWRGLRSPTSGSTYTARYASMRAASGP